MKDSVGVTRLESGIVVLNDLCGIFIREFARLYVRMACVMLIPFALFFARDALIAFTTSPQPLGYEFTGETIIAASCSPTGDCSTRVVQKKRFSSPDECFRALKEWTSYQNTSTVAVKLDSACRYVLVEKKE